MRSWERLVDLFSSRSRWVFHPTFWYWINQKYQYEHLLLHYRTQMASKWRLLRWKISLVWNHCIHHSIYPWSLSMNTFVSLLNHWLSLTLLNRWISDNQSFVLKVWTYANTQSLGLGSGKLRLPTLLISLQLLRLNSRSKNMVSDTLHLRFTIQIIVSAVPDVVNDGETLFLSITQHLSPHQARSKLRQHSKHWGLQTGDICQVGFLVHRIF